MRSPARALLVLLLCAPLVGCSYEPLEVLVKGVATQTHTMDFGETVELEAHFEGALATQEVLWESGGTTLGRGSRLRLGGEALPPGEYDLLLTLIDDKGHKTLHEGRFWLTVRRGSRPRLTTVSSGRDVFLQGETTTFEARAEDPEDGALGPGAFEWSVDGRVVQTSGESLDWTAIGLGRRVIRVKVRDSDNQIAIHDFVLRVIARDAPEAATVTAASTSSPSPSASSAAPSGTSSAAPSDGATRVGASGALSALGR